MAAEGKRESPAGQAAAQGQKASYHTCTERGVTSTQGEGLLEQEGICCTSAPHWGGWEHGLKDACGSPSTDPGGDGSGCCSQEASMAYWILWLPLGDSVVSLGAGIGSWFQGLRGWSSMEWRIETRAVGPLPHHELKVHVVPELWSGFSIRMSCGYNSNSEGGSIWLRALESLAITLGSWLPCLNPALGLPES